MILLRVYSETRLILLAGSFEDADLELKNGQTEKTYFAR